MQVSRSEVAWTRIGASSGYLSVVLGLAAASFERGAPTTSAPAEQFLAFFMKYRMELLSQSLLFVLSAGALLWFVGSLRTFLRRGEQGDGRLSGIVFGSGILWVGLQFTLQGAQVALAMSAGGDLSPSVARLFGNLTYALSVIGYVPFGVMLAAVAVISFRFRAFPAWMGWLSVAVAVINLAMTGGLVAQAGPLVPGSPLTYALYATTAAWQIAAPTVMFIRANRG